MRSLPPLNALRAFEATARHRSFQAAARELAVTPTAVSHQVRHLEAICGQPLLRRRPRPVAPTPAGAHLFPALRESFDAIAAAVAELGEEARRRPLRVTATTAFASRWLIPRLASWRERHPELELEVSATEARLDLHAAEADVAIRYARRAPRALEATPLASDRFRPVASPRLLGKEADAAALARLPLLHFEWAQPDEDAPTWAAWRERAKRRDRRHRALDVERGLRLSSESHAIEAAVAGQGVALASDVLVARELALGFLVPLTDVALEGRTYFALALRASARREAVRHFVAWVGEECRGGATSGSDAGS